MHPELSNNHISSSLNFWYLSGMQYGFHAIGGPVVGMSISNRLAFPTSVGNFDMIESSMSCHIDENSSLIYWCTWASSSISDCLLWLFGSGRKLESGGIGGSSLLVCELWWNSCRLFMVSFSSNFLSFIHNISLTPAFFISRSFNVPNTAYIGM